MGNQQKPHAHLRLQLAQQRQNPGLNGHVQGRGRLIGDQQPRFVGQGHRNHHALPLATGQLMGIGVQALAGVAEMDPFKQFQGAAPRRLAGHAPVRDQGFANLPRYAVQRVQGGHRLLKDHAHFAAPHGPQQGRVGTDHLPAANAHRATRMAGARIGQKLQRGQRADRLAGSGLADQRHGLALVHVEGRATHRVNRAEAHPEVAHGQERLSHRHPPAERREPPASRRPPHGAGRRRRAPPRQ